MMDRVVTAFEQWLSTGQPVVREHEINCHHNYTDQERHFGKQVWLSRKGAIDASTGTWGLIPGSMGTRSYVVQGKGNPMALNSSPHGAGRVYSRSRARRDIHPRRPSHRHGRHRVPRHRRVHRRDPRRL